ncbi:hypothetical protein BASA81_010795 [Batrachochytrium salamandrivorans]|nr:hypothetical protein BASA81_010795 [Batrachochytrium salamandrivorans]
MQSFAAFIALCLFALAAVNAAKCAVPAQGCTSQKSMYSCLNPLYTGCQWSCGANNKWCSAAFNDVRFPERGVPNENRNCVYLSGKGCCTAIPNCVLTDSPTAQPTLEPTPAPTNAPIRPTTPTKRVTSAPTKKPTKAPTTRCLPQPTKGCAASITSKTCVGVNLQFSDCCLWTPNANNKPGGKCSLIVQENLARGNVPPYLDDSAVVGFTPPTEPTMLCRWHFGKVDSHTTTARKPPMGNKIGKLATKVATLDPEADNATELLHSFQAALEQSAKGKHKPARNGAVVGNLITLSAPSSPLTVIEAALGVIQTLVDDESTAQLVFVNHHPQLLPVLLGAVQNGSELTQLAAIYSLVSLAGVVPGEMATEHPEVIPLALTKAEETEPAMGVRISALGLLQSLTMNESNGKRIAPAIMPTLVSTLAKHKQHGEEDELQRAVLDVMQNLSNEVWFVRSMVTDFPNLPKVLISKLHDTNNSEEVQVDVLEVLSNLSGNAANSRDMVAVDPGLISLLLRKLETNSVEVQTEVLDVFSNLSGDPEIGANMVAKHSNAIFSMALAKMAEKTTAVKGVRLVYSLSCSEPNRAIMRENKPVVNALVKMRKSKDESNAFFALLALVNLFGAMEDSPWLNTDEEMLGEIFDLIALAMKKDGWDLNDPLLAFRYLCVVEHNRQTLWKRYSSLFLVSVFDALLQAVEEKDAHAAENAVSTLSQFSFEDEPLVWLQNHRPQLDQVLSQLDKEKQVFGAAFKSAQFLMLRVNPPQLHEPVAEVEAPGAATGTGAESKEPLPTIMISYNWGHQAQARQIHQVLEAKGFAVWRDENNMKADIMDSMADAVGKSKVVLILVSQAYKESTNCKLECKFAHNNKRKLIPVLVQPGYSFAADGWLGLMLGSMLYYDVSRCKDLGEIEARVNDLLKNELQGASPAVVEVANTVTATATAAVTAPVVETKKPAPNNEQEIRAWLEGTPGGNVIADKLVAQGLVEARDLRRLAGKSSVEIKYLLELSVKQVFELEEAFKVL